MAVMAHSPRHQAARQRGAQTGERFEQAWQGIRQDRCDYQRPIPDAATLALQQLEAAVVYALGRVSKVDLSREMLRAWDEAT
jgi:hypothetical protein